MIKMDDHIKCCEVYLRVNTTSEYCFLCSLCGADFDCFATVHGHISEHFFDNNNEDHLQECDDEDDVKHIDLLEESKEDVKNIDLHVDEESGEFIEIVEEVLEEESDDDDNYQLFDESDDEYSIEKDHLAPQKKFSDVAVPLVECLICEKSFRGKHILATHNRIYHSIRLRFRCNFCDVESPNKKLYMKHLRTEHEEQFKLLEISESDYDTMISNIENGNSSLEHLLPNNTNKKSVDVAAESIYQCNDCQLSFVYNDKLINMHNTQYHSMLGKLQCEYCEFKTTYKNTFNEHFKHRHAQEYNVLNKRGSSTKLIQCTMCDRSFYRYSLFKCHLDRHYNLREIECPVCFRRFNVKVDLTSHVSKIHKNFNLKNYYEQQKLAATDGSGQPEQSELTARSEEVELEEDATISIEHKCLICDTILPTKKDLVTHMKTHNSDKSVNCPICSRSLKNSGCLKRHLLVHTGEKSFQCDICHKQLADRNYLVTHMRIHSGERPFVCSTCGLKFYSSSKLNAHIKWKHHVHDKIYKCDLCDKKFDKTVLLKRHQKLHTTLRPNKCEICAKSFKNKIGLQNHLHSHDQKKFQCSICDSWFFRMFSKRRHERTAHNVVVIKASSC